MGGLRAVGGVANVAGGAILGVSTGWTVAGAVAGGAVAAYGLDQVQAGLREVWTGESVQSGLSLGLQEAGVSRESAELVETGVGFVAPSGSLAGAVWSVRSSRATGSLAKSVEGAGAWTPKFGREQYRRLGFDEFEVPASRPIRDRDVAADWDDWLGPDTTDVNPFTGKHDPDRIWSQPTSEESYSSIRLGSHEYRNPKGLRGMHYHKEKWLLEDRSVINIKQNLTREPRFEHLDMDFRPVPKE